MSSLPEKFPEEIWLAIFTDKGLEYKHLKMLTQVSKYFREIIKVKHKYLLYLYMYDKKLTILLSTISLQFSIESCSELHLRKLENLQ